jgi:hypothetical protein
MVLLLVLFVSLFTSNLFGQCTGFPSATASDDCGNYSPLNSGANINSGQTFSVCSGSSATVNYDNVNLSGGTIRVCGNAMLSGNFNSGTIVVECGATLFFPNGLLLNSNVGIVNYGTVDVTGDLNFQNSNVYFYNESTTSRLFVSRDLLTAQNTNQTNYIKNRGYIAVQNNLFAKEGSFFCLGSNSKIDCRNFFYMQNCGGPANRFTKEDASLSASLRYDQNASLRSTVTNNDSIKFLQAAGSSVNLNGCGSFGNATLVSNANAIPVPTEDRCMQLNCFTLLPIELVRFQVHLYDNKNTKINWSTSNEKHNQAFELLRSIDGINWEVISLIKAKNDGKVLSAYEFIDFEAPIGIVYYKLKQIDFNGEFSYSSIQSITTPVATIDHAFVVYPNPATTVLHIQINTEHLDYFQIFNLQGQNLTGTYNLSNQELTWYIDLSRFPSGIYLIKTNLGSTTFSKR